MYSETKTIIMEQHTEEGTAKEQLLNKSENIFIIPYTSCSES